MSADLFAAFMPEGVKPEDPFGSPAQHTTTPPVDIVHSKPSTPKRSSIKQAHHLSEPSPLWKRGIDGGDILFDAEEAALDDDFGDFETVGGPSSDGVDLKNSEDASRSADLATDPSQAKSNAPLVLDLLDVDDGIRHVAGAANKAIWPHSASHNQSATASSNNNGVDATDDDGWGDFEQMEAQEPHSMHNLDFELSQKPEAAREELIADVADEEWEPFDEETPSSVIDPSSVSKSRASLPEADLRDTPRKTGPLNVLERPSNVPPPSSLLQLLSTVFQSIRRNNADATTTKSELASRVLLAFRTASRIIAGRTLRWKRDSILAQSVRIGQAGKNGGMKLVSVNKSETSKEDREVEDMIQDWSNYIHEFNSIITQAGLPPHRMRLSSRIPLKISKHANSSGSSKQCAVCGLKRTERLNDVDLDIDDLFGEFWVEHWGHRDCCDFWYSFKSMLGQR
ncbi:hypothetical protein PV04_02093 [Phialophora macrospora]|uniref:Uncharacterized protein n=1 Tax=Phialophora macrospora TaxID=1851006 RepID=A0A0D2FZU1_9EURO|nr:hypothetical protein PV04_02093 [Phialophora macrospora]